MKSDQQKQIILQEIQAWKTSRLLPIEYCDFLENIYSEGDRSTPTQQKSIRLQPIPWKRLLLSLLISFVCLLLVLHFTSFPMPMQMLISGVIGLGVYSVAFQIRPQKQALGVILLLIACTIWAYTAYLWLQMEDLINPVSLLAMGSLVLFVYLLTGVAARSRLIAGIGWLGLMMAYLLSILGKGTQMYEYGLMNIYWLVFVVISMFVAYPLGKRGVYVAPVWAISGLIGIYVPDILFIVSGSSQAFFIQVIMFLKVALVIAFWVVFSGQRREWLLKARFGKNARIVETSTSRVK